MRIIFVYGLPAVGKLTIAKEIAALLNFKLFHNHLVVDACLSVFEFGSPSFVELRERFWLEVIRTAASDNINGIVFTFSPDYTVRESFIVNLLEIVSSFGVSIDFVQITCPKDVMLERVESDSRKSFKKLADVNLFKQLLENNSFHTPNLPDAAVCVDSSLLSPTEAAQQIVMSLSLA